MATMVDFSAGTNPDFVQQAATCGIITTSVFDPTLCELLYRWFCPPGGLVLDPFAGGSVRGVIAALMGRRYVGIDLSNEQIEANRQQWAEISGHPSNRELTSIKVSAKMARLEFAACEPGFIQNCKGACCRSSKSPTGTLISINPAEQLDIELKGGKVETGLLQPAEGQRKCPFQDDNHLCQLHGTAQKPAGCIASPFTLNKNGTLIVRHRYLHLPCYKAERRLPAYKAFRAALTFLLGAKEAARLHAHLDAGGGDLDVQIPVAKYQLLLENDQLKQGNGPAQIPPKWISADAREIKKIAGLLKVDFLFSCPPYHNLERYSDDPRDLSNMHYVDFIRAYRQIITDSLALLRENRFACFVVGDIRDAKGFCRNFVGHTVDAFIKAGAKLYNDAILITPGGTLALRADKPFQVSRKLGKGHQNVLVFVKGDPRRATEALGPVEAELPLDTEG